VPHGGEAARPHMNDSSPGECGYRREGRQRTDEKKEKKVERLIIEQSTSMPDAPQGRMFARRPKRESLPLEAPARASRMSGRPELCGVRKSGSPTPAVLSTLSSNRRASWLLKRLNTSKERFSIDLSRT